MFSDWCQKLRGQWNVVTIIMLLPDFTIWGLELSWNLMMYWRRERNVLVMHVCVCVFWASVMRKANFMDWRIRWLDFIDHTMHIQPQRKQQSQAAEGMGETTGSSYGCMCENIYLSGIFLHVSKKNTSIFPRKKKRITAYRVQRVCADRINT